MKKYMVHYKLQGVVQVEANDAEQAKALINGIISPELEFVTDKVLINGIVGYIPGSDYTDGIDGDAIEVFDVEEVKEDA